MESKQLTQEQIQKLQDLKTKHRNKIIRGQNVLTTIYNKRSYSLVLDNFQIDKFVNDFKSDNLTYDFTFWLRALYLLGKTYNMEDDIPE